MLILCAITLYSTGLGNDQTINFDDQAVVRDGLSIMLNLAPDLEVIAVASNGRGAV